MNSIRPLGLAAHQAIPPAASSPRGGSPSSCGVVRHGGWKSTIALAAAVAEFNANSPVGTPGFVLRDNGDVVATKVTASAHLLGGHIAVACFEGLRGFYSIDRFVTERPE